MRVRDLVDVMESVAPTRLAEAWDNVGLLTGNPDDRLEGVMLCIDYTREVAIEARGANCSAVVAYHPPIFAPLKRVVAGTVIYEALRNGVAIYSPHTALDVSPGGTNDVLADVLGLDHREPLRVSDAQAKQCKLVTFAPRDQVDRVSEAMFAAGAGVIGNYTHCSFRSAGTGTFFGQSGTNPAVGQSGRLETADEIRIETVVPLARVSDVVSALRAAHPYEEPAFDLVQLAALPQGVGQGRFGTLNVPVPRAQLIERIKHGLGLRHVLVAGPVEGTVRRAACCAGSCGDLLDDALAKQVDLYLTGEMRHHDALRAASAGMTVVATLHSNSERATLAVLRQKLDAALEGTSVLISSVDRDPFDVM